LSKQKCEVSFTPDADRDLDGIHAYIEAARSSEDADELIAQLLDLADSLAEFPDRGSVPQELSELGEHRYRQLVRAPYRLIYRRVEEVVHIYLVADGRRDMQALLRDRLLWR
jgi:toxin ParE1/3/4